MGNHEALTLIIHANKNFYYLVRGGENPPPKMVDDEELILDERINTKEKVIKLLNETYTDKFSELLYAELNYVERNGGMYKPIYDIPEIIIWDKAKIIKITNEGNKAAALLELPYSIGSNSEDIMIKKASFSYETNKGWRLDGRMTDIK